jgi:hypothetical protein
MLGEIKNKIRNRNKQTSFFLSNFGFSKEKHDKAYFYILWEGSGIYASMLGEVPYLPKIIDDWPIK